MATERDVAASMANRVLETFRRDGIIPPELIRYVQAATTRRSGTIPTSDEVERYCREWMNQKLEADAAARPRRVQHSDDRVDAAVDLLMAITPTSHPKEWAESVELVDWASQQGLLSKAQVAQLDALNNVYASKAG